MLAVDTNVIIRYVVNDDPRQAAKARSVIDRNEIFITATVLLEADWVLRSTYRYDRAAAVAALRAFCGLPTVSLDRPTVTVQALDWAAQGMDLADALHLAASSHCSAMVSFDADLTKLAKKLNAKEVRRP